MIKLPLPRELRDLDQDGIYENLKVLWDLVQNKPTAFPPETHQHDDADLLGIDWSKILNKPSTFPPSSHTHGDSDLTGIDWSKILNKPSALGGLQLIYDGDVNTADPIIDLTGVSVSNDDLFVFVTRGRTSASEDDGGWYVLYPNGNAYTDTVEAVTISGGIDNNGVETTAGRFWSSDVFFLGRSTGSYWSFAITFLVPHLFAVILGSMRYYYNSNLARWNELVLSISTSPTAIPTDNLGIIRKDANHRTYTDYGHITVYKVVKA